VLPPAQFYGPQPAAAITTMKEAAKPSLKEAFSSASTIPAIPEKSDPLPSKNKGKKCTAHFGCKLFAAFIEEKSGTLYCRDHKPKHIPVTSINHSQNKSTAEKKSG